MATVATQRQPPSSLRLTWHAIGVLAAFLDFIESTQVQHVPANISATVYSSLHDLHRICNSIERQEGEHQHARR